MSGVAAICIAMLTVVLGGPLALALAGWFASRRVPPTARATPTVPAASGSRWNLRLTFLSTLLYVLAFNLTFFIQELFLVLPKAFTPGLRPTLFHNDHHWDGQNPLAGLFQGTGALATLIAGCVCARLLRRGAGRTVTTRLFLFWMAYSGIFMALPQVVIGAISDQSDLGMAMVYFGLAPVTRIIAALVAMAAIPMIALRLGSLLPNQSADAADAGSAKGATCSCSRPPRCQPCSHSP